MEHWENYHSDCETAINLMISMELTTYFTYLSMAHYFKCDDVALKGFAKFFKEWNGEEQEHANKLMAFHNKQSSRIFLQDFKKPEKDEWGSGLDAMQAVLKLEKSVNQAVLDLHNITSTHVDHNLHDFLDTHYRNEQVETIKKLCDHITNLIKTAASNSRLVEYKITLKESS
uniref:Ferritin n=1 Tax=Erpetoichthys calabaricus TaxID=27687 RepID=A0A8C4RVJ0_ERPCA